MSLNRSNLLLWLLGVLMVVAPLYRSGALPAALVVLELLSLAILVVYWWDRFELGNLGRSQMIALSVIMAFPLIYLIPLPSFIAEILPGRTDYSSALQLAAGGADVGWQTASLYGRETFSGWLVLLLPLAAYLAARSLDTEQLRKLLVLLFVIAGFQAILGLIQFGAGEGSPLYLGMTHTHFGSAVGTYASRNNFVGLMYLVLMVSLSLFIATLGQHRQRTGSQTLRQRLVYLSTMQGHKSFLFASFSLLILLAAIFSRSRGGLGMVILGILLITALLSKRIGGRNVFGMTGTIALIVFGFAVSIGLSPILDRFSSDDGALATGRWTIFDGTMQGIASFFPIGSGPATFQETFARFQDVSQASFIINQAHNDYLEWLYNGGFIAGALIIGFLTLYLAQWRSVWKKDIWGEFRFIQVGAGIGMLLMLLHEFVDYNLMIPANLVYFAFFAAVFFHKYEEVQDTKSMVRRRKEEKPEMRKATSAERLRTVRRPIGGGPVDNPFMD